MLRPQQVEPLALLGAAQPGACRRPPAPGRRPPRRRRRPRPHPTPPGAPRRTAGPARAAGSGRDPGPRRARRRADLGTARDCSTSPPSTPRTSAPKTCSAAAEVEPAGEHGEPAQSDLLVGGEQVVAPVEGRADGALPFGQVAGARRADRGSSRASSSRGARKRACAAASSSASGSPSSRRQIPATAGAVRSVSADLAACGPGPVEEHPAPPRNAATLAGSSWAGSGQRLHGTLELGAEPQRSPARGE